MTFKIGTHNTEDEHGIPTGFADIIGFTEAIPANVKGALSKGGYKFVVVRRQTDLVIAYKPEVFKKVGIAHYKRVVDGWAGVSPNRGTLKVGFELIATGERVDVFLEHRINAAFSPWIRGERIFRKANWAKHTKVTLDWIKKSIKKGRLVIAFGDLNTPHGVSGYQGILTEFGLHFDRIGVHDLDGWNVVVLSNEHSDHNRLRVTASSMRVGQLVHHTYVNIGKPAIA